MNWEVEFLVFRFIKNIDIKYKIVKDIDKDDEEYILPRSNAMTDEDMRRLYGSKAGEPSPPL